MARSGQVLLAVVVYHEEQGLIYTGCMARPRGLGSAGRARVQDSLRQFSLADEETKQALFNEEDAFEPWEAATGGYDNARPEMLGENTNGQDSTRITYCQYFFDRQTSTGNMYVSFRGTRNRSNGNEYVYTDVPVYAAKRFYTALSKGKSINRALNGLEQYGYMPVSGDSHFGKQAPTEYGLKVQYGAFGNANPITDDPNKEFKGTQQSAQGQLPLDWNSY